MDPKQLCVANVKYKKPTADDAKRTRGLLRYLTYRDSRDGHIKQVGGRERWADHGLGRTVGEIADTCEQYRSDHVLAFMVVLNPNPDLIAMVPENRRARFVRELTETVLDRFFAARGIEGGIEHSTVLHHRDSEDPQAPGLHNPHTHTILPGTYFDEDMGERVPLFFSRNKHINHIEMLHRVTEQTMRDHMDRYVGPEWEQRIDRLTAIREQQRAITEREPDGMHVDEVGRSWLVWAGVRRTSEDASAAGFYRHFPDDKEGTQTLEFRPLIQGLDHDLAEAVADAFAVHLQVYPDPHLKKLQGYAQHIEAEIRGESSSGMETTIDHEPDLALDL